MQTKKGVFALLLGSGVSRSAQIPTGWDIVLDLIRRLAAAEGKKVSDDPAQWYRENYESEPDYSEILDLLAKAPAERSELIKPYIEPSDDERELGLKQPTAAHRSIASLVAEGHVKVIVTTNFDRLMETALGDLGIVPSVVASTDAVQGTLPLAHNSCTVIKIHGDYVDARIKNTANELADYSDVLNKLLDQVFREYGLVICGWSGEWDSALRKSLKRSLSPWFSTYWVSYSQPNPKAQEIIDARKAHVVTSMDADGFFQRLADGVASIDDMQSPELLSVALAEASLKRYIDDPTKRIRIHDLVVGEANRVRRTVEEPPEGFYMTEPTKESVEERLQYYESATATLRALFTAGCYWGKLEHQINWVDALDRLGSFSLIQVQTYKGWPDLRYYPALLALYSGGLAAIAAGRYDTLQAILYRPTSYSINLQRRDPLLFDANLSVLDDNLARILHSRNVTSGYSMPYRLRKSDNLWVTLKSYIPSQDKYQSTFDLFEYLLGLAMTDLQLSQHGRSWAPLGLIAFRDYGHYVGDFLDSLDKTIELQHDNWEPLRGGMFEGSLDRLRKAREEYDALLRRRA